MGFEVRFWGVRGSIACPSRYHIRYGGNTSCVALSLDGERVILDAGTGIRLLGRDLLRLGVTRATLLLTHTHWDHINGFPFFAPAFRSGHRFRILAGHLAGERKIAEVVSGLMHQPMFPVPIEAMLADLEFEDFVSGEGFGLSPEIAVRTCPLRHPGGAVAYRVDFKGRSLCYVTDTEHRPGKPDEAILGLIEGADLVIYDGTYTEAEFAAKTGWGHSTWNEGVRLCRMAGARRLAVFHHDPEHDDDMLDGVAAEAAAEWEGAFFAREGMTLSLD